MHVRTLKVLVVSLALVVPSQLEAFAESTFAGQVDKAFGINGIVVLRSPTNGGFTDLVIQQDKRIVAVGGSDKGWSIARFRRLGREDASFSGDGRYSFDVNNGAAFGAMLDAQDRIIVFGDDVANGQHPAVARITPDGHLDHSFSGEGIVHLHKSSMNEHPDAMQLTKGRILIAATISTTPLRGEVIALNRDGTIDTHFGKNGRILLRVPGTNVSLADMFAKGSGPITVFGTLTTPTGAQPFVQRVSSDGVVNEAFGVKTWDPTINADSLLAVGRNHDGWVATTGAGYFDDASIEVARVKHNGTIDSTFAGDGFFDYPNTFDSVSHTLVQANGRILMTGTRRDTAFDATNDLFVMRLTSDGLVDPDFNPDGDGDGISIVDFGEHEVGDAATIDAGHHLLIGGWQGDVGGTDQFAMVVRILLH